MGLETKSAGSSGWWRVKVLLRSESKSGTGRNISSELRGPLDLG